MISYVMKKNEKYMFVKVSKTHQTLGVDYLNLLGFPIFIIIRLMMKILSYSTAGKREARSICI